MLYLTRPCTLHTMTADDGDRDEMGDPVVDDTAGTPTVCELQQDNIGQIEENAGRNVIVSTWTLILNAGEPVDGWSEVTIAPATAVTDTWDGVGERFTLDGEPWQVRHPRLGSVHHIEATVRKVG